MNLIQRSVITLASSLMLFGLAQAQSEMRSAGSGAVFIKPVIRSTEVRYPEPQIFDPIPLNPKARQISEDKWQGPRNTWEDETGLELPMNAPGVFLNFAGDVGTGGFPADPMMAAGPVDILVATNRQFQVMSRDGTVLSNQTPESFFGTSNNVFDPQIAYDSLDDRFVMFWVERNTTSQRSWFCLAVSNDSSAQGSWFTYRIDAQINGSTAARDVWADYPSLGFDADALGLSVNMYAWSGDLIPFDYVKIRFLRKSQVYAGGAITAWWDIWDLYTNLEPDFTITLSHPQGNPGGIYAVNTRAHISADIAIVRKFTDTTFSSGGVDEFKTTLTVQGYNAPQNLDQPGTSAPDLDAGDTRVRNLIYVGDRLAFPIANEVSDQAAIQIVECKASSPWNVISDVILYASTEGSAYGAVCRNASGEMVVPFARGSASTYASLRLFGKKPADVGWGGSILLQSGASTITNIDNSGRNRWGDYFGACIDPLDMRSFYVHGAYVDSNNNWRTQVARVSYKPTTSLAVNPLVAAFGQTINLQANLTRDDTGAAVANATLTFRVRNGAYSSYAGTAVTDGNGYALRPWTSNLPSGTGTIEVTYNESTPFVGSSGSASIVLLKGSSNLVAFDQTTYHARNTAFGASLTNNSAGGAAMPGKTIAFTLASVSIGSGVTSTNGTATIQHVVTNSPGNLTIGASFSGDGYFTSDSDTATLSVLKAITSLQVSAGQGVSGWSGSLRAQLIRNSDGAPMVGAGITFTLNGVNMGSAITLANGLATKPITVPTGPSAVLTIGASYSGDTLHNGDTDSGPFTRYARAFTGTVNLQDWTASHQQQIVDFQLRNSSGTVIETMQTTLESDGSFFVPSGSTATGNLYLTAKCWHWLKRAVLINVAANGRANTPFSLINGDIDDDNEVGPGDFGELTSHFGLAFGDPGFSYNYDLDGDGEIGPSDFGIITSNFGKSGD